MSVYVSLEWDYGGLYHYVVLVNDKKYDEFTSKGWLTPSESIDVARGYEEGLNGYLLGGHHVC